VSSLRRRSSERIAGRPGPAATPSAATAVSRWAATSSQRR